MYWDTPWKGDGRIGRHHRLPRLRLAHRAGSDKDPLLRRRFRHALRGLAPFAEDQLSLSPGYAVLFGIGGENGKGSEGLAFVCPGRRCPGDDLEGGLRILYRLSPDQPDPGVPGKLTRTRGPVSFLFAPGQQDKTGNVFPPHALCNGEGRKNRGG